jgi:hypothetical protein
MSHRMIFVDPDIDIVLAFHPAKRDFHRLDFESKEGWMTLWRTTAAGIATTNAERQNRDLD